MAINDQTVVNDGTLQFSDFTIVETATTGDQAGLSNGNVSGSVFDDGLIFTDFSAFASGPNSRVDAKVNYTVKETDPLTAIQQIGAQFNIAVDIEGESVSFGADGPSRDLGDIEARLVHSVYAINEDGTKGELLGSINLDISDPDFRDPPYEAGDFLLDGSYRELMIETSLILDTNTTDADLTLSVIENTFDRGEAPGALSGTYFCDEDHDGVDDGAANGDLDIAGKKVELFQADGKTPVTDFDGNPVDPVLTDENGNYRFDNLKPGDYVVKFEDSEAEGKSFIDKDVGNDDAIDSDADPSTGVTDPVTVYAGEETPNVDVGVETTDPVDPGTASLGDTVWYDTNKNGILDDGESGASGVTVELIGAGADGVFGTGDDISRTTTTDANGKYLFSDLEAGDYKVTFGQPDGYSFTTASTADAQDVNNDSDAGAGGMTDIINIEIGEAERDVDAGLVRDVNKICAEIARINPTTGNIIPSNSTLEGRYVDFAVVLDKPVTETTTFKVELVNGTALWKRDYWFGEMRADDADKKRVVDVTIEAGEKIGYLPKQIALPQESFRINDDRASEYFDLNLRLPDSQTNQFDSYECLDGLRFRINDRATSPVALDLNQDGEIGVTGETTSYDKSDLEVSDKTVSFDIDADGNMDQIEWLSGDGDAFLFDNRDGNAINDMDGSRLFGDANGHANGYEKMAELDADGDGMLRGDELEGLQLWVDNGDAVLTEDEIVLLSDVGVVALSTNMELVKDDDGRDLMQSVAELANGEQLLTEDVWFLHA